jgi:hypothetical protein
LRLVVSLRCSGCGDFSQSFGCCFREREDRLDSGLNGGACLGVNATRVRTRLIGACADLGPRAQIGRCNQVLTCRVPLVPVALVPVALVPGGLGPTDGVLVGTAYIYQFIGGSNVSWFHQRNTLSMIADPTHR